MNAHRSEPLSDAEEEEIGDSILRTMWALMEEENAVVRSVAKDDTESLRFLLD